jgi:hypothetical protein
MVEFIGDPKLFIVLGVVEDCLVYVFLSEFVDDLNAVEIDQSAVGCAARNVFDQISLDADLHLDEILEEGNAEMEAGLTESRLQHSQSLVDAHVALLNLVKT